MDKNKLVIFFSFVLIIVCTFVLFENNATKRAKTIYSQGLEFENKGDFSNAYYNFSKISFFSDIYNLGVLKQANSALQLGDIKTAYSNFRYLCYFSNDEYITPFALYNAALINIEHKRYKSAYKKLIKLYKKYPNSDYKKAACYQLGKILIRKNPSLAKQYFFEYLEYAPDGKFALGAYRGVKNLNFNLSKEENFTIARALYALGEYDLSYDYAKKCNDFETCFLSGKICDKKNYGSSAHKAYFSALGYVDETSDPKDVMHAISRYTTLSGIDKKATYSVLLQKTKHNAAYPAVLFEFAPTLPKIAQMKNYELVYKKYPESYWAAESLWKIFRNAYKNDYCANARQLALKHIGTYKNVNSTPAVKYWYAKILYDAGKKREARAVLNDVVKNHPNSYYAFASSRFLDGERSPFSTRAEVELLPNETLFSKEDIRSLFNDNQTLVTVATLGDISLLSQMRPDDEFIKIYIVRMNGNIAHSAYMAKDVIDKMDLKPRFSDVRMKLAYPVEYSEQINKYCEKFEQNPYLMLALMRSESTFNPKAQSFVGATGLMQLMPQTASSLGFGDVNSQMLYDVDLNIKLGVKYFSNLVNMFDDNEMLAVLSYNGGPGAVSSWKQKFLNYDFDDFIEDIPYSETQNYIKKVFAAYWNYINIYRY